MPKDPRPAPADGLHLTRSGWVRVDDGDRTLLALAPRLGTHETARILRRAAGPRDALARLGDLGEAAVVQVDHAGLALLTDANRSFPLFWRRDGGSWAVSDDVRAIARGAGADADAGRQFAAGALVLGTSTLYAGVSRTPPDAEVLLPATTGASPSVHRLGALSLPEDGPVAAGPDAGAAFGGALLEAVGALVSRNPAATFLLPLSGGADSRMLASAFVLAGARDVRCFTYGVRESAEAVVSRRVAEMLGLPWTFCATPAPEVRRAWRSRENARFLADTYTGAALPHIQDWYAVRALAEDPTIPQDAVVVPGHTAVRTLKDADLLDAPVLEREHLVDAIIARHFSQAGSPADLRRDPVLRGEIDRTLERIGYDGSPLARARALQAVNIDGRQSTYILNSVRGYESFGLRWAMPMLDAPLHRVVSSLNWQLTRDRDWYRAMTDEVFESVVGEQARELSFWTPTALPAERRARIKAVLHRAGLLRLAEHAASARTNLRHPMAFEAFAPSPRDYARRIALGQSPLGVFSRAFLEATWNPWMDWRDPDTWHTPQVRALPEARSRGSITDGAGPTPG